MLLFRNIFYVFGVFVQRSILKFLLFAAPIYTKAEQPRSSTSTAFLTPFMSRRNSRTPSFDSSLKADITTDAAYRDRRYRLQSRSPGLKDDGIDTERPNWTNSNHNFQRWTELHSLSNRRQVFNSMASIWLSLETGKLACNAAESAEDESVEEATAWADQNALTSSLYNPDGSLKEGVESKAKFQEVEFLWDTTDLSDVSFSSSAGKYLVNVDATDMSENTRATSESGENIKIRVSYDLPMKWKGPSSSSSKNELYQDLTVQQEQGQVVKALTNITVYQAAGRVEENRLEKAATKGVSQTLNVIPSLSAQLKSADLVGGRVRSVPIGDKTNDKSKQKQQKYYEFDLGLAPKTCDSSKDNLGLGFCPFDTIILLSTTVVCGQLYVFVLQCDKDQWKRSNADLRIVRSSFSVTPQ